MQVTLADVIDLLVKVVGLTGVIIVVVVIVWNFIEVRAARRRGVSPGDACARCGKLHVGKKERGEWM